MNMIDAIKKDHIIYFIGMSNGVKMCIVIWFILNIIVEIETQLLSICSYTM